MIAIDTNVLVRVLINDPLANNQCQLARDLINKAGEVWVSKVVLVETVWVLKSAYQFDKENIIFTLETLVQHPKIQLEDRQGLDNALTLFSATNADFGDCLILNDAQRLKLTLHTFDRKLSRLHGAERIVEQ